MAKFPMAKMAVSVQLEPTGMENGAKPMAVQMVSPGTEVHAHAKMDIISTDRCVCCVSMAKSGIQVQDLVCAQVGFNGMAIFVKR